MPQAVPIHTRDPSTLAITVGVTLPLTRDIPRPNADRTLHGAAHAASATHAAMLALTASVAELPPDDPRHAAAHDAIARFQPQWCEQVARVCRSPATQGDGLHLKAALLNGLVRYDDEDAPVGPPELQLAASLADDVLARDWWTSTAS